MINIPRNSLFIIISVIALLCLATFIRVILAKKNPDRNDTELKQRIESWWWMVILLFSALLLGKKVSIIFFGFLSFLMLKEFCSIISLRQADRRILFWAYLSIPIQYYFVYIGWYGMFVIFIPVYVFLFLPIRMVLIGQVKGFINSSGVIHWAVMLTVFSISHIAYLLSLPNINPNAGNIGLVLCLLLLTQTNDVFQYIWGKMLGKHKILPKISPSKTWEGFIGGLCTISLIAACIVPFLTTLSMQQGLIFGFVIGVAGFFGDVVISSVKRDLQIKDSGSLIPGHGGILDRMDSLIYTAPLFFHMFYYFS